ncbi:Inactive phospholipase D5, partial [Dissostichus eleginoides]
MRGQGIGLGMMGMPDRSLITAVQQKDYSAGVWLRRKDKLEHGKRQILQLTHTHNLSVLSSDKSSKAHVFQSGLATEGCAMK